MLKVVQVGDWSKMRILTKNMDRRFKRAINDAVAREAHSFRKHVLKAFRTRGKSSGVSWRKNERWTTLRKKSSKPLIYKGDLFQSITVINVMEGTFFVGVPNNARSKDGTKLTKIGHVHEFGKIIIMTITIRQYNYIMHLIRKYGGSTSRARKKNSQHLKPGSKLVIKIPERSFLRSTMTKHFDPKDVEKRAGEFVAKKMGWTP